MTRSKDFTNAAKMPFITAAISQEFQNLSVELRVGLAKETRLPLFLEILSKDEELCVRVAVAENPNSSREILVALLKDKTDLERFYLALNADCEPWILKALSKDKDELVRRAVAMNPNTEPAVLDSLSRNDKDDFVRHIASTRIPDDWIKKNKLAALQPS